MSSFGSLPALLEEIISPPFMLARLSLIFFPSCMTGSMMRTSVGCNGLHASSDALERDPRVTQAAAAAAVVAVPQQEQRSSPLLSSGIDPLAVSTIEAMESGESPDAGTTAAPSASHNTLMDQQEMQLSQLRKLLEQNLPPPLHKKMPALLHVGIPTAVAAVAHDFPNQLATDSLVCQHGDEGSAFTDGCSNFILESESVDTLGIADQEMMGDLLTTTQEDMSQQQQHHSSHPNSMLHSPVLECSIPGSPSVMTLAAGSGRADSAYMFQPICLTPVHASPSNAHMSSGAMAGTVNQTMHHHRHTSLPTSCTSSPFVSPRSTPIHLRSRNDSGQSTYSAIVTNCSTSNNSGGNNNATYHTFDSGVSSISTSPFVSPLGTPVPSSFTPNSIPSSGGQQLLQQQHNSNPNTHYIRNRSGSGFLSQNSSSNGCSNRSRHSSGPGFFFSNNPIPGHHPLSHVNQYHLQQQSLRSSHSMLSADARPYSTMIQQQGYPSSMQHQHQQPHHHHHPQLRHSLSMDPPSLSCGYHNMSIPSAGVSMTHRSRHFSSPFASTVVESHADHSFTPVATGGEATGYITDAPNEEEEGCSGGGDGDSGTRIEDQETSPPTVLVSTLNRCHSVPSEYEHMVIMRSGSNPESFWQTEQEAAIDCDNKASSACQTPTTFMTCSSSSAAETADIAADDCLSSSRNGSSSSLVNVDNLMLSCSESQLMSSSCNSSSYRNKWDRSGARLTKKIQQQQQHGNNSSRTLMMQSSGSGSAGPTMDQDLQTTLDDLRDFDNEFSRFAQELEATTTTSTFADE